MNARLADKAVVVTRAEASDGPLSRELKSLGLRVLLWPTVSIGTTDPAPLRAALQAIRTFHWIVFASRNAVAAVLEQLPTPPAGTQGGRGRQGDGAGLEAAWLAGRAGAG